MAQACDKKRNMWLKTDCDWCVREEEQMKTLVEVDG